MSLSDNGLSISTTNENYAGKTFYIELFSTSSTLDGLNEDSNFYFSVGYRCSEATEDTDCDSSNLIEYCVQGECSIEKPCSSNDDCSKTAFCGDSGLCALCNSGLSN
jgi:hypothetical protein